MATSPNFNWPEPDNTDLVKNGALAIRTAVNAIDTSLVDLKGGTTGQVLAKASGTDMDFTWVTSDDANAIQNAIVDAKGDLIAASAADTPARSAVGANDLFLTAASGEATGLKWAGAWETWSPTIANMTIGNGTITARYARIGKTIAISVRVQFGTTTSITGSPNFLLPVSAASNAVFPVWCIDTGVGGFFANAGVFAFDRTRTYLDLIGTAGTWANGTSFGATSPFTWGNTDEFFLSGTYEVA